MSEKVLVVAIYSHPEYYPPTLNAIACLSQVYDRIYVVHNNYKGFDWVYPANVTLLKPGQLVDVRKAEQAGTLAKLTAFLKFTRLLYKTIAGYRPDTILMYDYMPLLAYRMLVKFIRVPRILWYHNHDVGDAKYLSKKSLSWWAWQSEAWIFPRLNLFTLPAVERKASFPMKKLTGDFFFIPNYPSLEVYGRYQYVAKSANNIKLLYQGSIGPKHGLEEIILLLGRTLQGKELELVLKGFISNEYLAALKELAQQHGVEKKLQYIGPGGYTEVITNAATCHIGIGIHKKEDTMNKTLGTASNKIYEYAAVGLPVLLLDNAHFRQHLQNYRWTFFTDCSEGSLTDCLSAIIQSYDQLSASARSDFKSSLNFEHFFLPVTNLLNKA